MDSRPTIDEVQDRLLQADAILRSLLEESPGQDPDQSDVFRERLQRAADALDTAKALAGYAPAEEPRMRQMRKALEESERRFQAVVETQTELICRCLPDHTLTFVNDAYCRYFQKSMGELIGSNFTELISPEDRPLIEQYLAAFTPEKPEATFTLRVENGQGQMRWHQWIDKAVFNAAGEVEEIQAVGRDITEQKEMEEALRQSQERFRDLIENTSDWVWEVDAEDRYTYCSPKVKELLGYEVNEVLGRTPFDFMDEAEATRVRDAYRAAKSRREPFARLENENRHKDGHAVILETSGVPVVDSDGKLLGYRGIDRDVTQRKQDEKALAGSERLLRQFVEYTPAAVAMLDRDLRYLMASRRWMTDYRLGDRNIIGLSHYDVFPEARKWSDIHQRCLQGAVDICEEDSFVRLDGTVDFIRWDVRPWYDSSGAVGGIIMFTEVITERKKAQAALRESEKALRESEATLRSLFRAAPIGIGLVSQDRILGWANEQFSKITGYAPEELDGKSARMLYENDAEYHRMAVAKYERLTETGVGSAETRFRRKDGRVIDVLLNSALIDPQNPSAGLVFAATDISERKQTEDDLRHTAANLAQSNQELEQFAYVASHDLQEPLRMVTMYLDLIRRRYQGKLDRDADEFIDYATDGAGRMQALIADLLTISRVSTRGQPFQATDMQAVLDRTKAILRVNIQEAGAAITNDPLPIVMADQNQLIQLLQNLLSNAIKYRAPGRPCEIHVRAERLPGEWIFSVRDNGIGIEPQFFQRIFLIFQRLHTVKEYPGTGVGLAICKKIIERHNGRIWVESTPGEGSTFFFSIPDRRMEAGT